jgi:hypothetical protein
MTWQSAPGTYFGNGRAGVNPYEDWERETRNPNVSTVKKTEGWHPVYVRLVPKAGARQPYREAARRVLRATLLKSSSLPDKERLTIDMISLFFLFQAGGAKDDRFASFFVWRGPGRAYHNVPDVFEVVHVGPQSSTLTKVPCPTSEDEAKAAFESLGKAMDSGIPAELTAFDASEVVTTVIDDQIGFAHERFREGADKTRVEGHFVHQQEVFLGDVADTPAPGIILVGGLFNKSLIDQLLAENDEIEIYRKTDDIAVARQINIGAELIEIFLGLLGAVLLEKGFTPLREHRASHGTFITDIAAGHPVEDPVTNRPIYTFDLSRLSTADTSGTRLDVHSVLAVMFMTGVVHLFLGDKPKPMVINFSYALRAGPKDGTGFAEVEMARLVRDRHNSGVPTWLVLPAGNGLRDQCHALLSPESGQSADVEWRIEPGDQTPSYVEIWTHPVEGGSITITPPGHAPKTFELSTKDYVCDLLKDHIPIARVFRQNVAGRIRITIAVAATLNSDQPDAAAPAGGWIILAFAQKDGVAIHLDVQRDDTPDGFPRYGRQSYFDGANMGALDRDTMDYTATAPLSEPVQREYTLSSYGTKNDDQVIVAGGAIDRDTISRAALYSASGPGLGGRNAPELSAFSEETRTHPARLGAGMYSSSAAYYAGTSTAAALVTRQIADALSDDLSLDKSGLILALLAPNAPSAARDLQLGYGTLPYEQENGRPERRYRG